MGRLMTTRFTNLLLVEERLLEAAYFARQLRRAGFDDVHYKLNAFLSAARSVTFLLQKEMHDVPGWAAWWAGRQREMAADAAMRFFLLQRNHSQKAGRVRIAGTRRVGGGWTYRFVSGALSVPSELHQHDIADSCIEHVAKLARLTLNCIEAFPFYSNPRRAMTVPGVNALALDLDAVDAALGFPHGWTRGFEPVEDRIRILGEHFDGPDELLLARLARPRRHKPRGPRTASKAFGETLLTHMVDHLGKAPPTS
jgi:hypothetical protein